MIKTSMDFKKELRSWYKQLKSLVKDGLILPPMTIVENSTEYDLRWMSPFMYTAFEILRKNIIGQYGEIKTHREFLEYSKQMFVNDITQLLDDSNTMVIVKVSPDYEYALIKDAKGYLLFNKYNKPKRTSISNVVNAIKDFYKFFDMDAPSIDIKIVAFKIHPVNTSISSFIYKYDIESDDDIIPLEGL